MQVMAKRSRKLMQASNLRYLATPFGKGVKMHVVSLWLVACMWRYERFAA